MVNTSFMVSPLRGFLFAGVAQPAERLPCKQRVAGSIPAASPKLNNQEAQI